VEPDAAAWAAVTARLVTESHLVAGDGLSAMFDEALQTVGLRGEVLLVDMGQRMLTTVGRTNASFHLVEGSLAGRAFQHGELVAGTDGNGGPLLWVPMLDGTERAGVICLSLGDGMVDDPELRQRCWTLSGLMGHVVMSKLAYSDHLRQLRSPSPLSVASEMLWQLVPPRTFATEKVVVCALLEPYDQVAGDAYDYAVDSGIVYLAVFDGVGHDLEAGVTTALAVSVIRNARRRGVSDLAELAEEADRHLAHRGRPLRFVTAVLARLDTADGTLDYLVAGHPAPLLLRGGHMVKTLEAAHRRPLGVTISPRRHHQASREYLEPGDRLLFYSDGIVEARDADGVFFGERRLVDLTERTEQARLSAPETLRRLAAAVLDHQAGKLQDDATLLMLDWSSGGHHAMLPTSPF
jgi:Stage II sporulation protein E (SpoIIE)